MKKRGRGRPRTRKGRRGTFADSLRAARLARGLTQAEAAGALGVDRTTLARWETGSSSPEGPARRYVEGWIADGLRKGGNRG